MADSYIPIFFDWPEATRELSAQEKGRLIDAIVKYARGDGDFMARLRGHERYAFPMFQAQIDRSRADRENGRKGGRPRKTPVSGKSAGETPVSEKPAVSAGENPGFANNNNNNNHNDEYEYEYEHDDDYDGGLPEEDDDMQSPPGRDARGCERMVSDAWREHYGRAPNPATARVVARWAEFYGYGNPEMIAEAVQTAAMRNANDPVGYVRVLFEDWRRRGVGSIADIE